MLCRVSGGISKQPLQDTVGWLETFADNAKQKRAWYLMAVTEELLRALRDCLSSLRGRTRGRCAKRWKSATSLVLGT
jgi:hypothetical protein